MPAHSCRSGPASLGELLDWASSGVSTIREVDGALGTALVKSAQAVLGRGIVLTTSYSGTGAVEAALANIAEEFVRNCPDRAGAA